MMIVYGGAASWLSDDGDEHMNVAITSISKELDTTIHGVLIGLAAAILLPSGPEPRASVR